MATVKINLYVTDSSVGTVTIAEGAHTESFSYQSTGYTITTFGGTANADSVLFSASGSVKGWIYRYKKSSGAQSDPISYPGKFLYLDLTMSDEFWVRPSNSNEEFPTWERVTANLSSSNISTSEVEKSFSLDPYQSYRIRLRFSSTGIASIYVGQTDSTRFYAWWGTTTTIDSSSGAPSGETLSSADIYNQTSKTLEISVSSGTYYYLWVRPATVGDSMDFTVSANLKEDPWELEEFNVTPDPLDILYSSSSKTTGAGTVHKHIVRFKESGTARFYITGPSTTASIRLSYDTTPFDYDLGNPLHDIARNDATAGVSWDVTAGTTYWVWIRAGSKTTSLRNYILHIEAPGALPDEWSVVNKKTITNMTGGYSASGVSLEAKTLNRYTISFANSGTATFETDDYDLYIYLTKSSSFDATTGFPDSQVLETGQGSFTYEVEEGVTYYFWIRGRLETTADTYSIEIIPPPEPIQEGIFTYIYRDGWKQAIPYVYSNGWQQVGPAIVDNWEWKR